MKLFYNAHFWINGAFDDTVKGVLTKDGKIADILWSDLNAYSNVEHIDLRGCFMFPGFIDTHTHSFEGGLYSLMIDLNEATCIRDVLDMIAQGSKNKGNYIFAWNFDETKINENRFPTRKELDGVLPNKNLVLRRIDGHSCMVNQFACDSILGNATKLHCEDEVFRGIENDKAVHWFHNNIDDELILKAYHAAADIALKGGFTTIHTMVGDANMSNGHYLLLKDHLKDFAIDFELYPQSFNIDNALNLGAKRIGGCILADGSIGSMTAALYEPYMGKPMRGTLYQTDHFWNKFIQKAHHNNLQVAVHCIGDRAIDQINRIYHQLAMQDYKDLRHQLIHCEITDDLLLEHIHQSKAVPVMQPNFDMLWGGDSGFYAKLLGAERVRNMNRFGSMMDKGITITGSSDWYITDLNITSSIYAALNHHNVKERLSLAKAVKIYTENAAWLSHDENRRGSIQKGYDADFSVLKQNPETASLNNPTNVAMIIKKAEVVYEDMPH